MRRLTLILLAVAAVLIVTACGTTDPSGPTPPPGTTPTPVEPASPTPIPTPTPVPTPEPTLPPLDAATAFPAGWTLVASDTILETKVLATIGPEYAVAVACTGDSPITVRIRANGGDLPEGGVELPSIDVPCPATDVAPTPVEFEFAAGDYHGVSLSVATDAPTGTAYIVLVASHG